MHVHASFSNLKQLMNPQNKCTREEVEARDLKKGYHQGG
jgi:hypothetical protein